MYEYFHIYGKTQITQCLKAIGRNSPEPLAIMEF
jgi:hypothetical protein